MGRILISANSTAAAAAPAHPINVTSAGVTQAVRNGGKFNPTLMVVVSLVIISFFAAGFASGYLRRWLWGAEAEETRHGELMRRRRLLMNSTSWGPNAHGTKMPRGLDPDLIAAMPLVRFKDLSSPSKYFDCPVCLALFEGSDTLKMLPHCAHAFHSDCIDQWFRSHSTCPLCRVSMTSHPSHSTPIPSDAVPEPDFHVAMARAEAEASDPRVEFHVSCRPAAGFVPGIRGGTAAARAATLASIRRSRSVGTDLIHHGYVVDSEGTQHHRNTQVILVPCIPIFRGREGVEYL